MVEIRINRAPFLALWATVVARRERLAAACDRIRNRYGEDAVGRGTVYACRILTMATGGMGRQKEIALTCKRNGS